MARTRRAGRMAKRRGRYHHGNLRRALIEAGLALIARGGPEALTLREAARRAGVSQTAPYNHFTDKQALLAAVAEEGFRAMTEDMRRAAAGHEADPVGRLWAFGLAYVHFARAHPAHFRVMFGPEVADRSAHPALQASAAETFELLRAAISDGQRSELLIGEDPTAVAVSVWSVTHGLAFLFVDNQLDGRGADNPEALAERVMAGIFFGIAARQPLPRCESSAAPTVSG